MARTLRSSTRLDETGEEIRQPKRRGAPSRHPLPIDSSITDEIVEKFGNACLALRLAAEKDQEKSKASMGAYRAELKAAKKAGVDPNAIIWWINKRKQEAEDVNREIAWQNRMARVMGLPIGTQLGVDFETGETVASQVDERKIRKGRGNGKRKGNGAADPKAAYIRGYDNGFAGKAAKQHNLSGEAAVQYQKGWQTGQKDAAKQLGPEGETAH